MDTVTAKEISENLPMRVKGLTTMFKGAIIQFYKVNSQGRLLGRVVETDGSKPREICVLSPSKIFEKIGETIMETITIDSQAEKIKELRDTIIEYRCMAADKNAVIKEQKEEIEKLESQNKILRDALKIYACENSWTSTDEAMSEEEATWFKNNRTVINDSSDASEIDGQNCLTCGAIARKALAQLKEKK